MYKVAIVDDEIWVCRLIQKLIDWEELGLELAFVENDGESALERIIEEVPDIVISDIRMPDMDGIKMLESMREKRIESRVIIISGYPDFDYAKKVMQYGAYEYLLKPVDKDELKNVLIKVVGELRAETEKKEKAFEQNENLEKIKCVTSELFIRKLVAKRRIEESILKLTIDNKLIFDNDHLSKYTVIVIKAILDDKKIENNLTFIEEYNDFYSELKKCNKITFFIYNIRVFIISHVDDTADRIYDFLKQEYLQLKYKQGKNVVISYSDTFCDMEEMETEFDKAIRGSCQHLNNNNKEINLYPYSFEFDPEQGLIPRELIKMLMINVEALSVESMLDIIHEIYITMFQKAKGKPHVIQDLSIRISNIVLGTLKGMDEGNRSEFQLEKEFFQRISACNRLEDFEPMACEFFREKVEELYEQRRQNSVNMIEQAKQYIAQNYEKKITLGDVAGQLYINPKYFSNIFKKEVGIGFVEYLNTIRIDVSKDLLKGNKYSIGQIASKVGFSDPKHFAKLFKNKTNTTPKEYRQYHI